MRYVFYITNHGFGHASRNVAIMERLIAQDSEAFIAVKTDNIRCNFIKKNLKEYSDSIEYYSNCQEVGLILKPGEMKPDLQRMKMLIKEDFVCWDHYISKEITFLLEFKPDIVISDVVSWAIKAASDCGIKSILIGNFTWAQMYQSFYDQEIWGPYLEYYKMADKAIWYEIHDKSLEEYCEDTSCVSLVTRKVDKRTVEKIKSQHKNPFVFISVGASAELEKEIDVGALPYDFAITRGLNIKGDNVNILPDDTINTPDYIAAADYIIAKGGWSTVAEILLQRRKCALLFRGSNSEDNNTRKTLERRGHCVSIQSFDLNDIESILNRIDALVPTSYDIYHDDSDIICDIIYNITNDCKGEHKNDTIQ